MEKQDQIIYWLGQRDMIANIFMWLREEDINETRVIRNLANLYNNQFDGENEPNPHVEYYLEALQDNK